MRAEELRRLAIFEGLSDERLEQLLSVGHTIETEPGLQLFTEEDSGPPGGPSRYRYEYLLALARVPVSRSGRRTGAAAAAG